jgi:hypothetical protein
MLIRHFVILCGAATVLCDAVMELCDAVAEKNKLRMRSIGPTISHINTISRQHRKTADDRQQTAADSRRQTTDNTG